MAPSEILESSSTAGPRAAGGRLDGLPLGRLAGLLRLAPGVRLLDCARGPAMFLAPLASSLGGRGTFRSLRLEDNLIRLFSPAKHPAAREFPCVRLARSKAARIPLPEACVDRVVMAGVLAGLPDAAAFLAEIRRLLSPGGLLCLMERESREDEALDWLRRAGFTLAFSHAALAGHWCLTAQK